jgi:hypothetical protein
MQYYSSNYCLPYHIYPKETYEVFPNSSSEKWWIALQMSIKLKLFCTGTFLKLKIVKGGGWEWGGSSVWVNMVNGVDFIITLIDSLSE